MVVGDEGKCAQDFNLDGLWQGWWAVKPVTLSAEDHHQNATDSRSAPSGLMACGGLQPPALPGAIHVQALWACATRFMGACNPRFYRGLFTFKPFGLVQGDLWILATPGFAGGYSRSSPLGLCKAIYGSLQPPALPGAIHVQALWACATRFMDPCNPWLCRGLFTFKPFGLALGARVPA